MEEQLAYLKLLKEEYDASTLLKDIEPLAQAMEEQGILVNHFTTENIFTVTALWQALDKVYKVWRLPRCPSACRFSKGRGTECLLNSPSLSCLRQTVEASLQEQILIEQGRKVTPEQLREIGEVFSFFNSNKDGQSVRHVKAVGRPAHPSPVARGGGQPWVDLVADWASCVPWPSLGLAAGLLDKKEFSSCCTGIGLVLAEEEV